MNKQLFSLLLFFSISVNNLQCTNKIDNMTNDIIVTVQVGQNRNLIDGAVPVIVSIDNKTDKDISFLLAYPNDFTFETSNNCIQKKEVEFLMDVRSIPIVVSSNKTFKAVYFLNRYFSFPKECSADISYNLATIANDGSKSENISCKGEFQIELVHGTDEQLKSQYAYYSEKLKSEDELIKKEAAEALLFIDNPLCIDYIIPMLSIENLEATGIQALKKFKTPKVRNEIQKMLRHRESGVVSEAIYALNTMKAEIPRQEFVEMLSSANASIRYIGLEQLELNPTIGDRKYVRLLLNDKDPIVAKKADKYYRKLNKLLAG